MNGTKYLTIVILIIGIYTHTANAITNPIQNTSSLQIIGLSEKISPENIDYTYINASEFYKNKKRTFEVGLPSQSFVPQSRKDINSINYFKSLNLSDDYIYGLMQFDTLDGDPTKDQMNLLAADNITLFEYHGDHTYYAKIPRTILETKSYDFVRWVGLVEDPSQKINKYLKEFINITNSSNVNITLSLYEKLNNAQLELIKNNSNELLFVGNFYVDINIDKEKLFNIAKINFIKEIERKAEGGLLLDRSIRVIAADYVWDFPNDGSGISVGILDSGIQDAHLHFDFMTIFNATDYVNGGSPEAVCGESNCSDDLDNDGDFRVDEGTHGVHVAGIVSGQSIYNNRLIRGVSYKATLVIGRIITSEDGWGAPPAYEDTIWQNILDPDNDGNYFEVSSADVISNSWRYEATHGAYEASSKEIDRVVKGELGRPVPVIFAAGNDHPTFGVTPPSTAKNAITVGASGDFKSSNNICQDGFSSAPSDLYVMEYSSRQTDDGRVKPDILAPGSDITSSVINNAYNSWDGTSMAVPHVSAVAAQLLKNYTSLTPASVKAFLLSATMNGSRTNNYPNNIDYNQGWGRLDAYRAVYQLSDEYEDEYNENILGKPGSGYPQVVSYTINIPVAADRLIVTLVWDDIPGAKNSSQTLYNDLDLYLRFPNGSVDSSTKEDDTKNNVEKYIYNDPINGAWTAHVTFTDLNGTNATQNFTIKYQIEREATTPRITATLNLNQTMIKPSASAAVSARVNANGNMFYDIDADLDISSGLTITSSTFDGTDGDKDKVGDIPAGGNRYTRNWTVRGDSVGSRTVTANVNGFRIDGLGYSDSDSATLTVCNDDDNDGYFLNSCGGNDCNDNNANINPDASEICDGVDNNCNGIIDEVCTPLGLKILFPVNNAQYQSTTLDLNWTSNNTLASCYYKLDESNYNNVICKANYSYSGFSFSVATQDTSPEDVTKKGNNFYVVGRDNEAVYEYDSSGTYTGSSFSVAGQDITPLGITWNGSRFYVTGGQSDKVYEYDSSGVYTGFSFSVSSQDTDPTGITTKDGTFFVSGAATQKVYQYNSAGTYTGFNFSVTNQETDPEGIVWDGISFYVVGFVTDRVYEYNPLGQYTGFNFSVAGQDTSVTGLTINGSSIVISGTTTNKVYKYISNNAALSNTTLNNLSIGRHNVTIYGKGSDGNTAQTNYTYFNITTVQPDTTPPSYSNLKTNPTSPATYQKNQQYQFNVTWQDNVAVSTTFIEFNGINYTMSQNVNEYYRTFTDLAVGSYNYYFWANDTSGNSNKTNTLTYTINKATPTGSLTNNISWSITYGKHVSIGFTESNDGDGDLTYRIYRNQTDVGSGEAITLAAGIYQYILNTTGGQNYSSTSSIDAQTLTVNKAQSSTSLTFDKTSPQTYGTSITPTCSVIAGVGISVLTMNGTVVTSGSPLTLGAGTYQFNCSLAESQNYTSSQNISAFVINQAVPNLTYYLNGLTQNITLQYPQKINASAYTTGGTVNIFRNGTTVTSENSINVTLAAGYHQYEFNATGNQNYTDVSSKFLFASITKGASTVYTYVNGVRSNITIDSGTSIYLNGTLITGEGPIQLYNNGTLINSGQSPLSNLTTFNTVGLYNITTIYQETQNYTSSFEAWWVNVTQATPPTISNLINSTTTNQSVRITWSTNENANETNTLGLCPSHTGVFSNQNNTLSTSHVQSISALTNSTLYCFNTTACDSSNNCASSNFSFVTASTILPEVTQKIDVNNLSILYDNSTLKIFEFSVNNTGIVTLSNINWSLNTGLETIRANNLVTLQTTKRIFVFADYNYTQSGVYTVNASAFNGTIQDWETIIVDIPSITTVIDVNNLTVLNESGTERIFEFRINNTGNSILNNVNWTLNSGLDLIKAINLISLQPAKNIFVFIDYNYTQSGNFIVNATAFNGTSQDWETIIVDIPSIVSIDVRNLLVLNESGAKRIFEFLINNTVSTNLTNVSWIFDTKNSNVINSTTASILQYNKPLFVFVDYNFTITGTFNVNSTARNGTLIDSENLTITVS